MFESLQDRIGGIFKKLTSKGALSKKDVDETLGEIRAALIEADVALPVVRNFIAAISEKAVGTEVIRSVKPGQMVVKIVHDELVNLLGNEPTTIDLTASAPIVLMLIGLQGSGKTTTCAKLALKLKKQQNKKILMVSLDTQRPAAQEQLKQLGEQIQVETLPIIAGQQPTDIASRALIAAKKGGFDIVLFDTAGRTHIDEPLMQELQLIKNISQPHETLLVADSLTGQDAVNVAQSFNQTIPLTGIILTKLDGDGRGGAALSMRVVTGTPIKAVGVGEKIEDLEDFYPKRIIDRILGMGDIVSLVEKASETFDKEKTAQLAKKIQKGKFDFNDLATQLQQMQKLGGMGAIMSMLPGMAKIKDQALNAGLDDNLLKKQLAIISSMTPFERTNPDSLKHKRKQRIASGAGVDAAQINKLIKMHRQMADMMKAMGGKSKTGMMQNMLGKLGGGLTGGFMGNAMNGLFGGENISDLTKDLQNKDLSDLMSNMKNSPNLPGLPKK